MPPLERIETVQLGERTVEALRSAIIRGELAPGEPLRDRQLAEALGVSRTPVREALHRLEAAGLVEARGRTGWAVTPFTEQDVRELFQLRMLLEPTGLDVLEREPDPARISVITSFFADYEPPIDPALFVAYFRHDDDFHRTIVDCSGNRRINSMYDVMNAHINRGRFFLSTVTAGRVEETLVEHRQIVEAVAQLDFDGARAALLGHLRTGEALMLQRLEELAQGT